MSSSPTAPTSTTASSSTCPSPSEPEVRPLAVIACGALGRDARLAARQLPRPIEVHCLPAELHNRPDRIAGAVEELALGLLSQGRDVAVAYADCGTYGALRALCERLGLERLPGLHCYDLVAGDASVSALLEEEPGTYLLTDFLAASFSRLVLRGLGLDRHPELVTDYFGHYRRVVWLSQHPTDALARAARRAADFLGLPLEVRRVGEAHLRSVMVRLLATGGRPTQ